MKTANVGSSTKAVPSTHEHPSGDKRFKMLDAAMKRDRGESVTMESACAKYFASEMVGRVADRSIGIRAP